MTSRAKPNSITGLIATVSDVGEKDKLATLLTGEGKLSVYFKGVRSQTSKLKHFAAPYVFADFLLAGMTVSGVSLIDAHIGIFADLNKAAAAAIITDSLLKCAGEGAELKEELPLALISLKTVETAMTYPITVALWFLIKLFLIEGVDFNDFPLTKDLRTLFKTLTDCGASDLDALEMAMGDILNGLRYAEKIFFSALGFNLKSVAEAIKLAAVSNLA